MKLRYRLIHAILDFSINNSNSKFADLLTIVRPIICDMYNNDAEKVNLIQKLSYDFRKYLLSGEVSSSIDKFIND